MKSTKKELIEMLIQCNLELNQALGKPIIDPTNFKPKKSINSKYSNKMVNNKYYQQINISEPEEFVEGNAGNVLAPYIMGAHTEESSKEYDEFMKEYHKQHQCCPKCGHVGHSSTLMGYPLELSAKEKYKDLNKSTCSKCGDVHTMHERVPIKCPNCLGEGGFPCSVGTIRCEECKGIGENINLKPSK